MLIIASWIVGILCIGLFCKKIFPTEKELTRKVIHVGTGPIVPLAWWLEIPKEIAVPFAIIITILLIINYQLRILPGIEEVNRHSYGTIAYGISISLLLILFWPTNPSAAAAGVLIMAFGDGLAGLIGRKIQSPSWIVLGQRKSVMGTLTMWIVSGLILLVTSLISENPLNPFQIILISTLATSLEQIGPWGVDNLTVPIGIAYSWIWVNNI